MFTCNACGARYPDEAWSTLVLAQRIEPVEVGRMVLDWPGDVCIEVRRCGSCEGLIALKRSWPARLNGAGA